MKQAAISGIIVPEDRIRKDFDDVAIEELASSIYRQGLIHPILLRPVDDSLELVAGENRLLAVKLLFECGLGIKHDRKDVDLGNIPFAFLTSDNEVDAYEAELDENLKRRNLTWKEETLAIAKLHELRVAQYGEASPHDQTGWSISDTANEISRRKKKGDATRWQEVQVAEAVNIAKHLDDPFVAAAKDKKEAMRTIREKVKHEKRQKLAKEFLEKKKEESSDLALDIDLEFDDESTTAHNGHTLIKGDFFIEAYKLPDETFDVVLTDPPYGKDIHKQTLWDGSKHDYDDSEEYFNKIITTLAEQSYRVLKPEGHVYVFCDITRFDRLFAEFEIAGFRCWTRPLIWDKGNTGSFGDPDHGPRACYDAILFAIKGEKKVTDLYRDVINITQPTIGSGHPASKPPDLYHDLLRRSVYPGDKVLDFFTGSGPIFPAAEKLLVTATGIEKNEKYYLMSLERLSKL